jgi:hypothetical protein
MVAKHGHIRCLVATAGMVLPVVLAVAEAENPVEGPGSAPQISRRADSGVPSPPQKRETPYEILRRTRGTRETREMAEAFSASPVVAKAQLRLVPPTRGSPTGLLGLQRQDTTVVRPPELREAPADAPKEPVYFTVRVGDRSVPGITYRSTRGWRRVKLRLDTDGDGLLSDETEYVGKWLSLFQLTRTYQFGPAMMRQGEFKAGGDVFYAQCSDGKWLTFRPAFYREGKVTLDNKAYKLAAVDCDFDGKYNRVFVPPAEDSRQPRCDVFAIDLDGDSKFDFGQPGVSEIMPLSRLVKVNGDYYNIRVSEDGSTVEFRRATPRFGTLDFGDEEVNLWLWSDAAHVQLTGPGSKWRVPAGKYGVVSLELTEKDSEGNRWTFRNTRGSTKTEKLGAFEVRPGETTSFRIGPPFQVKASIDNRGGRAWVDFELEGRAGELYKPGGEKNKTPVPEPGFKIIDGAGRVVDSGRFKYG